MWIPIEKEKKLKKGFLRIYRYAPSLNKERPYLSLQEAYKAGERNMGARVLTSYYDIPLFSEK